VQKGFHLDEMNIQLQEKEYAACVVVLLISTASCAQYMPAK